MVVPSQLQVSTRLIAFMWFFHKFPDRLIVMHTRPEHAPEALRGSAFPDGQFVVLDGDRSVGATTTLRLH